MLRNGRRGISDVLHFLKLQTFKGVALMAARSAARGFTRFGAQVFTSGHSLFARGLYASCGGIVFSTSYISEGSW